MQTLDETFLERQSPQQNVTSMTIVMLRWGYLIGSTIRGGPNGTHFSIFLRKMLSMDSKNRGG